MATLPTNYVDAVWSGQRKYEMTQNQDSTVSFTDVTEYSVTGSYFGASNINATNTQVNGLSTAKTISISSTAWSSSTQTVIGVPACSSGRASTIVVNPIRSLIQPPTLNLASSTIADSGKTRHGI